MVTKRKSTAKPAVKAASKIASKAVSKAATKTKTAAKTAAKPRAKKTTASDAIDRQLERYRDMRDFKITAEPSGKNKSAKAVKAAGPKKSEQLPQLPFVIQKHAASHLHYDFRLGWNGVLKSWAVAKGPSYFTGDKRLAVQVEDHPMEYGGFEGIIPQGQYGGGTVMLWDQGTWSPQPGHTDVDQGLRAGSLKFTLHGTKMKGNWALVRMGGKAANERKPNWLLIKEHDSFEYTGKDKPITEAKPDSVVTGRNLDEIARNEDHVWNSKETAKGNAWYRKDEPRTVVAAHSSHKHSPGKLAPPAGTPEEKLPGFLLPQLALQSTTPPKGNGWLHELKLDGYRIQARKNGSNVQLLTRTGLDWTHRMKTVAAQLQDLPAETAILDGELVVLAPNGTTSFADLQAAFQEGVKKPLTYFAFDLLHLNGHNLRGLPLVERKSLLAQLLKNSGEFVRLSEHLESSGEDVFHKACEFHAEGIICKRSTSVYSPGRSSEWLKLKCIHEQEFVIGGFTLPSNGSHGIGALLLGYYEDRKAGAKDAAKKLIYAGRTGTGFTQKTHRLLRDQLDGLRQNIIPFDNPPTEAKRGAIWVKPQLVAQINFATWTADNLVRQAAFKGLREDKPATEVHREEPGISPKPRAAKHASHSTHAPLAAKTAVRPARRAPAKPSKTSSRQTAKSSSKQPAESAPVRLTHPDKVLDAETQLTKQQLADYYWAIAPHMLPHIAGRPLSLVRCPEGSEQPCFYQKHVSHMLPPGIESIDVPDKKTGKPEPYITLSTPEALAGLAQMGVLEVHPWGSRNDDLEHPDRIIIDLDPDLSIPWSTIASSAAEVRKQLKKLGLESFLKLTGGKGLHVVAPIEPRHDWATVKQFAHAFVLQMEKADPQLYLTKMTKSARKDRIYLDYLRNERGATAVAPYSPRARAGAAVSLPLHWADLKLAERPVFHVAAFDQWKSRLTRDPWKQLLETSQRLTPEMLALLKITPQK
jgi:bifunctional non-homologous end joining protein LigD